MPAFEGASALICDPATQQHRVISCFIANRRLCNTIPVQTYLGTEASSEQRRKFSPQGMTLGSVELDF